MKISLFFLLAIIGSQLLAKGQAVIQIEVSGISSKKGEILAALFSSEKGFPNDASKAYKTAKATPANGKAIIFFNQIPEGKYAIALFHDTNGDGKLNTNILGIPKEGYGVSKNVRNLFSAPGFEESSFRHGKSKTSLSITIQY
jgi:uncharacterized protein (DUF2141 family)